MQIWIDGDACPKIIKEIIFRAAIRTKTLAIIVSNQNFTLPDSIFIKKIQVGQGFDVADNKIIQDMQAGDLVITADIPLADAFIDKHGTALNPRGELYSKENIKAKLALRNFTTELRDSGIITGGPSSFNQKNIQNFANQLDKFLMKNI